MPPPPFLQSILQRRCKFLQICVSLRRFFGSIYFYFCFTCLVGLSQVRNAKEGWRSDARVGSVWSVLAHLSYTGRVRRRRLLDTRRRQRRYIAHHVDKSRRTSLKQSVHCDVTSGLAPVRLRYCGTVSKQRDAQLAIATLANMDRFYIFFSSRQTLKETLQV